MTKKTVNNQHSDSAVFKATGVVGGIGYGPAVWVRPKPSLPTPGDTVAEADREDESRQFLTAADAVAQRLLARSTTAEGQAAEVLRATAGMVGDRGWRSTVLANIDGGHTAEYSLVGATDKFQGMFEEAGGVIAERIPDLKDIRDRVLAELRGEEEPGLPEFSGPVVLLAEELSPADAASLDPDVVVGLVTELGGPTSHTAIITRQLGLPCIIAAGSNLRLIEEGTMLLIDGGQGTIEQGTDPDEARRKVQVSRARAELVDKWRGPGRTSDGHPIELLANVADGAAAVAAAQTQAEGIGLYRTELSFLAATEEPSTDEQAAIYRRVFDAFPDSKVVIRTLDAGSDKPLSYATKSAEENPALGVRGLRIARHNEQLLTRQLDAIATAAQGRTSDVPTWVMAPMVSTKWEAQWFAELCRERGLVPGAMIEVPAAALMADKIMPELDFVSIGTNDLTQYTMAADRLSPQLAYLTDPWQPAVLRLIRHTSIVGRDNQIPVGVCGEAAADPLLAAVLTGLGVNSLSATAGAISGVGAQLAELSITHCERLAEAALMAEGPVEARAAARAVLARS